jgi:hypothetical protein
MEREVRHEIAVVIGGNTLARQPVKCFFSPGVLRVTPLEHQTLAKMASISAVTLSIAAMPSICDKLPLA